MSRHLRKYPEGWKIFGKVKHMFPQEIAGALINIFDVTFSARQGRMTHQHFLFPEEIKDQAINILTKYGYHEFTVEEHNEERLPEKTPPVDPNSGFIPILIYKIVGMLDPDEAKALTDIEKETTNFLGYGGGYDTVWKMILLQNKEKFEELLNFLSGNGIQYILPDGMDDPVKKQIKN
jgi:hypothetical protein